MVSEFNNLSYPRYFIWFFFVVLLKTGKFPPAGSLGAVSDLELSRQLTYALSVRSSSFLNLGREDKRSVNSDTILNSSRKGLLNHFSQNLLFSSFTDLFNSFIIDIRSSVCHRLSRITNRCSRIVFLERETVTTRLSEGAGTKTGIQLKTNLVLFGIPDNSLLIDLPRIFLNAYPGATATNTAKNE